MKTLGFCQSEHWKEQAMQDSKKWHVATGSLTPANTPAYEAGYQEGYRAALSVLKLHGFIDMDHNR
jgi:hypothetical protein